MDKRLKRINKMRDELFDIANSFAGDETGAVAVELHGACNRIFKAIKMIETGIKPEDHTRQTVEWLANNPGLLDILSKT